MALVPGLQGLSLAQDTAPAAATAESAPVPSAAPVPIPLAPEVKGNRPKSDPTVLAPAATQLEPDLQPLASPPSLALPTRPAQVKIQQLRPLGLREVETLAETNNPNLKAVASQVDQAKSNLRAQISAWYPNINLSTGSAFPALTNSYRFRYDANATGPFATPESRTKGQTLGATMNIGINWDLINPQRVPQISAARDQFEQAQNQYLIALRDLRLQAAQTYFTLQLTDEGVRIGQESVRASLVSLKDARARFQAGVSTKLEVLQAETQLARDQQLLTNSLAEQSVARRSLASLLDLPQNVTPTAKEPARVVGSWMPSLQESIVAAYAFREELDQVILQISIANSNANAAIGAVQPFLSIVNNFGWDRSYGQTGVPNTQPINMGSYTYGADNSVGLNLRWNLFDGGRAAAQFRQQKQAAEEQRFNFADRRDQIRLEVETSFYQLLQNNRDITTTSRAVISSREALRLARLRFQAGVTTQREVVDSQRDLTQAEVSYARAVTDYNRRLAELRRRTGLDQVAFCQPPSLPSSKPASDPTTQIPIEPQPLLPACQSEVRAPDGRSPLSP
ncbi:MULTISPECIES: TolC family protein [unclassified Synechococcus]|uniref:TolC family protein n=1 Tax=unclassified Synechococcus TaxID=2626047 RepID=UPI00006985C2|nr:MULTISPECIES: TolC family protein [unclassified Synechococcus]EAQ75288.1 possible RND family outer membrane efflux protein [Synechococcus sp. WH 5701]WFN59985.1 TolC family protein [Synechococcus sp. CCFWC 502]